MIQIVELVISKKVKRAKGKCGMSCQLNLNDNIDLRGTNFTNQIIMILSIIKELTLLNIRL